MQITSGFKLKPHKQGKTLLEYLRFPARGYQNRGKNPQISRAAYSIKLSGLHEIKNNSSFDCSFR